MKLKATDIKALIMQLGFNLQDGEKDIYYKSYSTQHNYIIKVNFETEKIEYGIDIKLGDLTTSNFENSENFVVLECVDRLLEKGYPPKYLSLEHKWPMGRKEKGKLDILVLDSEEKAYLMIECKTWGAEYEKEKKKMLRYGGQLFSYYVQNKAAQYLCLYTSCYNGTQIEYANEIVKVDELWHELNDYKEIFAHWNKNFKDNGIFNDWATAYEVEIKALTRGQLKELTSDDSSVIFNQFAEILRHNVVSDKPNAFNKILNLFICKIIDEDKNDDEEVDFQWFENDTNQTLQTRLNNLYKKGMSQFLDIEVTDYTDEQLDAKLYNVNDPEVKKQIQEMFLQLRLQKNPEFAFKEVYNEQSFADNAIVVKEVVELLQPYQFRYGHKQQFLGDFFELLLSTSIKQEAGQFFTPVPIAKFIISSLPIKEFIQKRLQSNSSDSLPVAIDYAAGSGHFLNEWMDEVQNVIDSFDLTSLRPTVKKKFKSWQENQFEWAKDYVYGIEADYRLVKTAKVSSFLNGDGEALIIRANGLDKFDKSKNYKCRLKEVDKDNPQNNAQFDVLIANPPYSVSAFKNTVQYGEESFELFDRLTENSSEIECLFIERAKQLLCIGGWAGIVLPSTILSNKGIEISTREIILKYFYIKAIVELGSNTFMATNTNTVIMFLERRANTDYKKLFTAVNNFFDKPKDATVLGIEKAFGKFIETTYEEILFEDYISFINRRPNENIKQAEIYIEYRVWFDTLTEIKQLKDKKIFKEKTRSEQEKELDDLFYQKVFEREKEKIMYFLLVYPQQTVIIKVGEKQAEKDFLGYEFSNRRGHEGIKMLSSGTKLYDEMNPLNSSKANSYIYRAFLNSYPEVTHELSDNIFLTDLYELIDFRNVCFDKFIVLKIKKKEFQSKWEKVKIGTLLESGIVKCGSGYTFSKRFQGNKNDRDIPFYKVSDMNNLDNKKYMYSSSNYVSQEVLNDKIKGAVFPKYATIFPKVGMTIHTNKKRILSRESSFDNNIMAIWSNDENSLLNTYLYEIFCKQVELSDISSNANPPSIASDKLGNMRIPIPPREVQQKIVEDIETIEKNEKIVNGHIGVLKNKIQDIVNASISSCADYTPLNKLSEINPSRAELQRVDDAIMVSFIEMASVSENGYIVEKVDKRLSRLLQGGYTYFRDGDIIIAKITPCMENGKCALVSDLTNGIGMGSTEFHVVRADETQLLSRFAFLVLNREEVRAQAKAIMTGKSGHRRVPSEFYEDFTFPMIPIDEQKDVIAKVEQLEQQIASLEESIKDSGEQKSAILKKYLE